MSKFKIGDSVKVENDVDFKGSTGIIKEIEKEDAEVLVDGGCWWFHFDDLELVNPIINPPIHTQPYYRGSKSLYAIAMDLELNPYEYEILKRVVRCRHKGQFIEDLNKTKDLIDIYIKESGKDKS